MTGHWLVVTMLYCLLAIATSASADGAPVVRQETGSDALAPGRPSEPAVFLRLDKVLGTIGQTAAVEPWTIPNMSAEDARDLFIQGMQVYQASSGLAAPFSHSDAVEASKRWSDYTGPIETARTQMPQAFLNTLLAYDRAKQLGADTGGLELAFPEALHMMQSGAGAATYSAPGVGQVTAMAAWDPYYASQPVVRTPSINPDGSANFDVPSYRSAASPAEYLRAIGADPALAAKIQPLIDGVQPGQYLKTAQKIFTLLNPQFASTPFGQQLATLVGGG